VTTHVTSISFCLIFELQRSCVTFELARIWCLYKQTHLIASSHRFDLLNLKNWTVLNIANMSYRVGMFIAFLSCLNCSSTCFEPRHVTAALSLSQCEEPQAFWKLLPELCIQALGIELMNLLETASTGRAGCQATECKGAGVKIDKDELRVGTWVTIEDHGSWRWRHW
jgi:hypothetical protein